MLKKRQLTFCEGLLSCGADVLDRNSPKAQTPYAACTGEVQRVGDAHCIPT